MHISFLMPLLLIHFLPNLSNYNDLLTFSICVISIPFFLYNYLLLCFYLIFTFHLLLNQPYSYSIYFYNKSEYPCYSILLYHYLINQFFPLFNLLPSMSMSSLSPHLNNLLQLLSILNSIINYIIIHQIF